ncbi:chromatin assembly factor 1 subunit A-like [Eriocheir sinensis]|uniref:chromatin assembly factor 1 subunit A-like n=1 Tax=Eriocheir sinensis TaxID=95602 RepID=UPI0021C9D00E|nr:chromatin assembly factor 1 subunit A-like [Eriocheir sinensis]
MGGLQDSMWVVLSHSAVVEKSQLGGTGRGLNSHRPERGAVMLSTQPPPPHDVDRAKKEYAKEKKKALRTGGRLPESEEGNSITTTLRILSAISTSNIGTDESQLVGDADTMDPGCVNQLIPPAAPSSTQPSTPTPTPSSVARESTHYTRKRKHARAFPSSQEQSSMQDFISLQRREHEMDVTLSLKRKEHEMDMKVKEIELQIKEAELRLREKDEKIKDTDLKLKEVELRIKEHEMHMKVKEMEVQMKEAEMDLKDKNEKMRDADLELKEMALKEKELEMNLKVKELDLEMKEAELRLKDKDGEIKNADLKLKEMELKQKEKEYLIKEIVYLETLQNK